MREVTGVRAWRDGRANPAFASLTGLMARGSEEEPRDAAQRPCRADGRQEVSHHSCRPSTDPQHMLPLCADEISRENSKEKAEFPELKEFRCNCWIFGFYHSRPEVLSLVFTVAGVPVVKLKTSPPLKGKLLHIPSPTCPTRSPVSLSVLRLSIQPISWLRNTSSELDTPAPALLSQQDQ